MKYRSWNEQQHFTVMELYNKCKNQCCVAVFTQMFSEHCERSMSETRRKYPKILSKIPPDWPWIQIQGQKLALLCNNHCSLSPVNQLEDNQQVPRKTIFFQMAAPIGEEWRCSNWGFSSVGNWYITLNVTRKSIS